MTAEAVAPVDLAVAAVTGKARQAGFGGDPEAMLGGLPVFLSGVVPDQTVEIRDGRGGAVRFRLDDPYLKGTKLARDLAGD